jgi:hypothetical protein
MPTEEEAEDKRKNYYIVKKILDHRTKTVNNVTTRHFKLEWNARDKSDKTKYQTTWEPESHLDGCINLLQDYCKENKLEYSTVKGLLGADKGETGHNIKNWTTMDAILDKLAKLRSWKKQPATIKASEWTSFGCENELFFLPHEQHCYVLLYIHHRRLAYVADGANLFRKSRTVADELKELLKIRLISLPYDSQLKVDHCGSSAILIAFELLKMYQSNMQFKRLVATKDMRAALIKSLHVHESKPMALPPLTERHKSLSCQFCNKRFKSTDGRALSMHIGRSHNN